MDKCYLRPLGDVLVNRWCLVLVEAVCAGEGWGSVGYEMWALMAATDRGSAVAVPLVFSHSEVLLTRGC